MTSADRDSQRLGSLVNEHSSIRIEFPYRRREEEAIPASSLPNVGDEGWILSSG